MRLFAFLLAALAALAAPAAANSVGEAVLAFGSVGEAVLGTRRPAGSNATKLAAWMGQKEALLEELEGGACCRSAVERENGVGYVGAPPPGFFSLSHSSLPFCTRALSQPCPYKNSGLAGPR